MNIKPVTRPAELVITRSYRLWEARFMMQGNSKSIPLVELHQFIKRLLSIFYQKIGAVEELERCACLYLLNIYMSIVYNMYSIFKP
jgi:hypothetical protein